MFQTKFVYRDVHRSDVCDNIRIGNILLENQSGYLSQIVSMPLIYSFLPTPIKNRKRESYTYALQKTCFRHAMMELFIAQWTIIINLSD
jgi:hypothetical protein